MCATSAAAESHALVLKSDPLRRDTYADCVDHKYMSNKMSTHHQPFAVITKKKPLMTCSRFLERSGSCPAKPSNQLATPPGTPCVRYVRPKKFTTLYCELRQFHNTLSVTSNGGYSQPAFVSRRSGSDAKKVGVRLGDR